VPKILSKSKSYVNTRTNALHSLKSYFHTYSSEMGSGSGCLLACHSNMTLHWQEHVIISRQKHSQRWKVCWQKKLITAITTKYINLNQQELVTQASNQCFLWILRPCLIVFALQHAYFSHCSQETEQSNFSLAPYSLRRKKNSWNEAFS